jgi:hypothetical protein
MFFIYCLIDFEKYECECVRKSVSKSGARVSNYESPSSISALTTPENWPKKVLCPTRLTIRSVHVMGRFERDGQKSKIVSFFPQLKFRSNSHDRVVDQRGSLFTKVCNLWPHHKSVAKSGARASNYESLSSISGLTAAENWPKKVLCSTRLTIRSGHMMGRFERDGQKSKIVSFFPQLKFRSKSHDRVVDQ